jgi:pimeloyl-ACP methyl ester carboxylesterase
MEHLEVDGLRIAYDRAGSGHALVLVHGFVGDARSTWASQLEALCDEFTVVAWDAPGAGDSSDVPVHFRLSDYADCLAAFVGALGLTRPHLAGLSFGGALVLELYRRHPTLPRTLVLVSAYAGWAGSLTREEADQRLQLCLRNADLPPQEFVAAMLPSMFSDSAPEPSVSRFGSSLAEFRPAGFRTMARSLAEADLRDMLADIAVPTLVLHGDADVRAPLRAGEALHSSIPGSRLVVLPGVGHMSSLEAPDDVSREIRDFLHSTER